MIGSIPRVESILLEDVIETCAQLHDKRTGLYLMSNGYIAEDFIYEKQKGY